MIFLDSIRKLLSNNIIFTYAFLQNINSVYNDLLIGLLLIFFCINTANIVFQSKGTQKSELYKNSAIGAIVAIICITDSTVITTDNRNSINQTYIQDYSRAIYYQGIDIADEMSLQLTKAYISYLVKSVGLREAKNIKNIHNKYAQTSVLLQLKTDVLRHRCEREFDYKGLNERNRANNLNITYPLTKRVINSQGQLIDLYPTYLKAQFQNVNSVSLSFCGKTVRDIANLNRDKRTYEEIIAKMVRFKKTTTETARGVRARRDYQLSS